MPQHESRMIEHALTVLEIMVSDRTRRPLTACEKLACRVLVPHVGLAAMKLFCDEFERGNTMQRGSHLGMRLEAIREAVHKL